MTKFWRAAACTLFLTGSTFVLKADSLFNFDNVPDGTQTSPTGFSDTNNGVTATFTSAETGAFIIQSENQFQGFGGGSNLYEHHDPMYGFNFAYQTLAVGLSSQMLSTSLNFTLEGDTPGTLTIETFLGGTQVGTYTTALGTEDTGGVYSYGTLQFTSPGFFDSFTLSTADPGFAIDDLAVSPNDLYSAPEPATVAFCFFGLAGLLAFIRNKRGHRTAH